MDEKLSLKPIFDLLPVSSDEAWRQPSQLDHEKHLKIVDEVLRALKANLDDTPSSQKSSLRGLLYAFGGIFVRSGLKMADFSVKVDTELTVGAGTGSSASFAVCLCAAMVQLVKLRRCGDVSDLSLEEKGIVSAWAFNCEKITHGAPSGEDFN